jgi:hypothetical protein
MSAPTLYLPSSRVTVIAEDGSRRPWTPPPPEPEPEASERVPVTVRYRKNPVIPAPSGAGRRRRGNSGRPVVCIRADGTRTRFGSVAEAAKATGENPGTVWAKCSRGRFRQSAARLRFMFAEESGTAGDLIAVFVLPQSVSGGGGGWAGVRERFIPDTQRAVYPADTVAPSRVRGRP